MEVPLLSAAFADYLASFHLLGPQHVTLADCATMLVNIESLEHYMDVYGSSPTASAEGLFLKVRSLSFKPALTVTADSGAASR
mgnify:FL=1